MTRSLIMESSRVAQGGLTSQNNFRVEVNALDKALSRGSTGSSDTNGEEEDDVLYGDQDDAQSFIAPVISPIATRVSFARSTATDRLAAMERLQTRDRLDGTDETPPETTLVSRKTPAQFLGPDIHTGVEPSSRKQAGLDLSPMPSPWITGPKEFVVESKQSKSSIAGVFGNSGRPQRASSMGKRLSKAFPSMNISSTFLHNFTPPAFLSSGSDQSGQIRPEGRPSSVKSRTSSALRRTNSEDALYHSLSRVSSFGDDARWSHIREQVNVRVKAIKDSWDAPTFKLPNIIPESLKTARLGLNDSAPQVTKKGSTSALSQRTRADSSAYAVLDNVLESLTGDIVIMGGYRGSILRSSQPPHRQLWVPVKVGLNIRKVNLEVGLEPEDEETMEKHIFASGMLQNIGPVDISKRLFKRLRDCDNAKKGLLRVHDFGYDWRLSPHLLSRKLVQFLAKLPSNQPGVPAEKRGALVIAHSLGGIISRHAVNQRPELFSGVVYAGAPQRCINVLGPLRNGDAVLLNEKVLTARVNFSLRTTFVFLPEDGFCFIDKHTGQSYNIDFYDVDDWIKYRLSPCVSDPALPALLPKSSNSFGLPPLRSLSGSFPILPLRGRSPTNPIQETVRKAEITKDRTLAPQILFSSSSSPQDDTPTTPATTREKNIAYLTRTLAQTKLFRSQLAHNPSHQSSNIYPPISVLYGKEIPTVYAARVNAGGIPHADAYDELLFHSGDGVVLAREAMPPAGYEIVRGGRIATDRGHITMLGDMACVGRALEAVVRGRRRGIGLGGKE